MTADEQAAALAEIARAAEDGRDIDARLVVQALQPFIDGFAALLAPLSYLAEPLQNLLDALNALPAEDESEAA